MIITVVLSVLRIIGLVLLIVLLVILALVALILFVPIRYCGRGSAHDPKYVQSKGEGGPLITGKRKATKRSEDIPAKESCHNDTDDAAADDSLSAERILKELKGEFSFSWLLHLIGGHISYPDDPKLMVRILFFRFDAGLAVKNLIQKNKDKQKTDKKDKDKSEQEKKDLYEKFSSALAGAEGTFRRISTYWNLFQKPSSKRAVNKAVHTVTGVLGKLLPRKWKITGTIGTGDPEYTAMVLEAEGILFPLVAGHVNVTPDFEHTRLDVYGFAKGHICVFTLLSAAIRMLLDKDVRRLVHRIRKSPSESKEHSGAAAPEDHKNNSKGNNLQ